MVLRIGLFAVCGDMWPLILSSQNVAAKTHLESGLRRLCGVHAVEGLQQPRACRYLDTRPTWPMCHFPDGSIWWCPCHSPSSGLKGPDLSSCWSLHPWGPVTDPHFCDLDLLDLRDATLVPSAPNPSRTPAPLRFFFQELLVVPDLCSTQPHLEHVRTKVPKLCSVEP